MKTKKYYQVTNTQFFFSSILVGVISAALIIINMRISEYLQLPMVTLDSEGKCVSVANYKNGEAYQCSDVDTILRNYRVKKNN